jgi:homospermidine synthase
MNKQPKGIDVMMALATKNKQPVNPQPPEIVPNGHEGEVEPKLPAQPAPVAIKQHDFANRVVCIGTGSVFECMFPVLISHLNLNMAQVTLIDMLDRTEVLQNWIDEGATFEQIQIVKENFEEVMNSHLSEGDLCIDLAYDISCIEILKWCRDNKVMYINTSIEEWDFTDGGFDKRSAYDKSLYARRMEINALLKGWPKNATTACLEMGANPGLISTFAKKGLMDLAKAKKKKFNGDFAELARDLGVKVVLDTERDTQIVLQPREPGEFIGTWSCLGLLEEATSPAELGWGTHEGEPPMGATVPAVGPKNQIFLHQMGMNTRVRGFVPPTDEMKKTQATGEDKTEPISQNGQIIGVLIRHGEAYTISDFLTTKDGKYRPTVYYCYLACDSTMASLQELRANDYKCLPRQRIAYDNDISGGADTLGCMIGGYDDKHVWWCGSSLNIEDACNLVPLQNATTVQVAIGVVSAICWMLENPTAGIVDPEDIDHEYILKVAKPYLGNFISKEFEWSPVKDNTVYFPERKDLKIDTKNIWSFSNFLDQN